MHMHGANAPDNAWTLHKWRNQRTLVIIKHYTTDGISPGQAGDYRLYAKREDCS
ncbi:hypothetical protein GCM10011419_20630 [Vogesella fluminis]|uniref:Uncharacterized protein n=1 Tax=Vogesella fluminis TaxID=1069161 RepID=A0ABQ3HBM7_9NEIS|nr:hypothetical protein GCM10011419_20630 [Vogesella fluminis]